MPTHIPKGLKLPKTAKITPAQWRDIACAADDLSAMVGSGGGSDSEFKRIVKTIDRFLKSNGLKRQYK